MHIKESSTTFFVIKHIGDNAHSWRIAPDDGIQRITPFILPTPPKGRGGRKAGAGLGVGL